MPGKTRVVVTGIGIVSPIGIGREAFWPAILCGRSAVGPVQAFDASAFPTRIAAEVVRDSNFDRFLTDNDRRRYDDATLFAYVASRLALEDSLLDLEACHEREAMGVIIGTSHGPAKSMEREITAFQESGIRGIGPFGMANANSNSSAGLVAMKLGLKGPNYSPAAACAAGTASIGEAYEAIAAGRARMMLAGGTESCITPYVFAGYSVLAVMSRRNDEPLRASRPFDRQRDGFVMAEGAGVLLLEELNHAQDRGAPSYAEIVGYGSTSDATHAMNLSPNGAGIRRAMQVALDRGEVDTDEVDYINAYASSTLAADRCESAAIRDLFKGQCERILVNSTKSLTGHMMGASGAVEVAVCALSIENAVVHGTRNLEEPDPDCGLEGLSSQAVPCDIRYALSNSMGFWGPSASLLLRSLNT